MRSSGLDQTTQQGCGPSVDGSIKSKAWRAAPASGCKALQCEAQDANREHHHRGAQEKLSVLQASSRGCFWQDERLGVLTQRTLESSACVLGEITARSPNFSGGEACRLCRGAFFGVCVCVAQPFLKSAVNTQTFRHAKTTGGSNAQMHFLAAVNPTHTALLKNNQRGAWSIRQVPAPSLQLLRCLPALLSGLDFPPGWKPKVGRLVGDSPCHLGRAFSLR